MKKDLDHLPLRKQQELAIIVDVLHEEFAAWVKTVSPRGGKRTDGQIVKIILFGSYARGDWVDDRVGGYHSDYDILIVVNKHYAAVTTEPWTRAEDRFFRDPAIKTPVQLITHTMGEVNTFLAQGQYFFTDIVKEGIALYEAKGYQFREPQPPTAQEALRTAQEHFEEWMGAVDRGLELLGYQSEQLRRGDGWLKDSAFQLHQVAEKLYVCFLLTMTNYRPRTHNLTQLRSMTESRDVRLRDIWPDDNRPARRRFQLLKRAYVEARYSKHYKIEEDDLAWLTTRVQALRDTVDAICEERLAMLQEAVD